jgi:acyl-CoA synthetase (AMP-forming)/AMP-acid ligase II
MLAEVVTEAARAFGDRVAYVSPDGWPITYAEIDRLSDEAAVGLREEAGIGLDSVVALLLPNGVDYVVLYAALAKLGATTAGLNSLLTPRERTAALECAGADLVLATADLGDGIPAGARVLELVAADHVDAIASSLRRRNEAPAPLPADPNRGEAICFTSGSTGAPKGALFRDVQMRAVASIDTGGAGAGYGGGASHSILATPLAHVGGMTKTAWMLRAGGTTHLMRRWRAHEVMELTERYRMPALTAGPTQVALILRQPDFDQFDFSSVKAIIAGTGPSTPALIMEARERLHAPYSVRYSSTESGGTGTATALDAPDEEALYTIGRPRAGVEVKVADDEGRELPVGDIGELWLRSGAVMSEYWRNPEETARTLVNGWLRTGDLAWKDEMGCFRLAGRKKEMFIRGGYNVYPMEVEKVLGDHPKVAEIALVPRPDPVMGEVGVAVVVPRRVDDPPTLDDLREFGERGLARYKLPERLRLIDEMPLNASHKLDRRALRAIEEREG